MSLLEEHYSEFDQVAEGITPFCVFGMMASLVYFLIDLRAAIMPEGVGMMKYLFFFFLIAVVGLNRLRMRREEFGHSWVVLYTALAVATLLFLSSTSGATGSFTGQMAGPALAFVINVCIMAIMMVGTDRISVDCSLDKWSEESVSEGLLTPDAPEERVPKIRAKGNRPGLLVILLALPAAFCFGISQYLLPKAAETIIRDAWIASTLYIFFSLALLAVTSARSQRLYMAVRKVEVEGSVLAMWLLVGGAIATAALAAGFILPKPNLAAMLRGPRYSEVEAKGKSAPFLPRGGTREPRPGTGEGASAFGRLAKVIGEKLGGRKEEGAPKEEGEKGKAEGGKEKGEGGGKGGAQQPQQVPAVQQIAQALRMAGDFGKKLIAILIILALIAAVLAFLFPRFARLLRRIRPKRGWLKSLLARLRRKGKGKREAPQRPRRFPNPFKATRLFGRMSPSELARYTYKALMAYADYRGCGRSPEETPFEYARRLEASGAEMAVLAASAGRLYVVGAYSAQELPAAALKELRAIWDGLEGYAP